MKEILQVERSYSPLTKSISEALTALVQLALKREEPLIVLSDIEETAWDHGLSVRELLRFVLGAPQFRVELLHLDNTPLSEEELKGVDKARLRVPSVADLPYRVQHRCLIPLIEGVKPENVSIEAYVPTPKWIRPLKRGLYYLKKHKSPASLVFFILICAIFLGWALALGLAYVLLVHEMGHLYTIRRHRIAADPPFFFPFVGAFINLRESPKNAWQEATIGISGPLVGTIGVLILVLLAPWFGADWGDIILIGMALNLLNLIPVLPLDGGRVATIIHRKVAFFVLFPLGAGAVAYLFHNTVAVLIILLGFLEIRYRWNRRKDLPEFDSVPFSKRAAVLLVYLSLLTGQFLFLGLVQWEPFRI